MSRLLIPILLIVFGTASAPGYEPAAAATKEWKIGEDVRQALIYAPSTAKEKSAPLVFAFHGHGGNMNQAAKSFAIQKHFPDAICVYMQGLPTPGRLTDPEGKRSGWQQGPGQQSDRDLKFFDEVLATMRNDYKVDESLESTRRVTRTAGASPTSYGRCRRHLCSRWSQRHAAPMLLGKLKPKQCLHLAGSKDPLVKYEWQRATMDAVRKLNGCEAEGKPDGKGLIVFESKTGTPLAEYVYDGGHAPPADAFERDRRVLQAAREEVEWQQVRYQQEPVTLSKFLGANDPEFLQGYCCRGTFNADGSSV